MHIAFDHQVFATQEYGGISRYFAELTRHLGEIQHVQATVVAPLHINQHLRNLPRGQVSGIHMPALPKTARLRRIVNRAVGQSWLRRHAPDVLHETYYTAVPLLHAPSSLRVTTVHDMIYERYPELFPDNERTSLNKRASVARADHVICPSAFTRAELIEFFDLPAEKASVVPHGVRLPAPQPLALPFETGEPFLLYVGKRDGYKNFAALLDALPRLVSVEDRLRLLCFGGQAISDTEQARLRQLGLSRQMLHHVSGNDAQLAWAYRSAAAYVCPSVCEGFGLPAIEAMASGCPVVAAEAGSLPEVLGPAAVYFDPDDSYDLARAVLEVIQDKERAGALRRSGHARSAGYTWEACAQATLDIYRRLLPASRH